MVTNKNLNYSYWENKSYFGRWTLIVAGSGIVGLSTALAFRKKNPTAKIIVLERGILPSGASTKNAGFACFGSPGELLDDLTSMPEETVWNTVRMRWEGLKMLRKRVGDKGLRYEELGGFELFYDKEHFEKTRASFEMLNKKMKDATGKNDCFSLAPEKKKQFTGLQGAFVNRFEGQLDAGEMMSALIRLAHKNGITILNGVIIEKVENGIDHALAHTNAGTFKADRMVVATNGFARELLDLPEVKPARAQVLVTGIIPKLNIKGTFHFDRGFYYFRNIDGRILFGGGRNMDLETEFTDKQDLNDAIQERLEGLLKSHIIPGKDFSIERRWTGIMGVGPEKRPIVKFVAPNIVAAVRMGGMGVAIGSWVGEEAASLLSQ
jgi:gamma-glutamylputrescine oxidase